ncbi:MAG: imidazolonepropionase, partial [Oligoflexia bacterium]|nr:imidazolonepropionase [Oligoflexia bacterium]
WVGKRTELPSTFKKAKRVNLDGRLVLPGFVDSHTHLVFAGDRSSDLEKRLNGASYQEIAAQGGGILRTVTETRKASPKTLDGLARERIAHFLSQGVTTIEAKSGYGLDLKTEQKILACLNGAQKKQPATIVSTYLAAHDVPVEFKGNKKAYVDLVTGPWLEKVARLCHYADIFIDKGFFDVTDGELLAHGCQKLGLPLKVHADELELTGGTEFAVHHKALSADHLLKIGPKEITLLANSETTATLLPTTAFYLKTGYAPARDLLNSGARVCLASDFNPGTSPTQDISLVGVLAALYMEMATHEIITALTLNGAYALGLQNSKGALLPGFDCDFVAFESDSAAAVFYQFGQPQVPRLVATSGKLLKF